MDNEGLPVVVQIQEINGENQARQSTSGRASKQAARGRRRHLAIQSGGIMANPEGVQQILISALRGVVLDSDDLRVPRIALADRPIRRIVQQPLAVAHFGLANPRHSLERELRTPEAACPKCRELQTRPWLVIVRPVRRAVVWIRLRCTAVAPEPQFAQPAPWHDCCCSPAGG